jgi:murein DD-endopeptidase MepM/ murein hydrolase activator NlpD
VHGKGDAFSPPEAPIKYDIPDGLKYVPFYMPTGTKEVLENYVSKFKASVKSIFDPYYDMYGPFYYLWVGRENITEAIWQVNRYRTLRRNEINRLLNEVEIKPCKGDPVFNPEIAPQTNSGIQGGMHDTCARWNKKTSCKGIKGRKWHNGVDLKNPYGAPIYAIYDGTVTKHVQRDESGNLDGAGYYSAIVSNVNGQTVRMVYFHLQEDNRITGNIQAGEIIGYQGDSGNLKSGIADGYTESHVHIKAQENGANVNPLNHFKTKIDLNTGQLINPCN